MSAAVEASAWRTRNQDHLVLCVQRVRRHLEHHLARQRGERPSSTVEMDLAAESAANADSETRPAIEAVSRAFGLSPFERGVLLLCAAVELDADVARLCATLNGDAQQRVATFGLALATLPEAHWSALAFDAPLRRYRLVEVQAGPALTASALRIDERVLHHLAGVDAIDPQLAGFLEPIDEEDALAPSHLDVARRLADAWCHEPAAIAVQLCGEGCEEKRAIVAHACRALGLRPMRMAAHVVPTAPADVDALARLWARESALAGAALLLDAGEGGGEPAAHDRAVAALVERIEGPLALAGRERRHGLRRAMITLDVERPTAAEQVAAWTRALGARAEAAPAPADVEMIAAQFSLSTRAIAAIAARVNEAHDGASASEAPPLRDALWAACRSEARPHLDDQAQRITASATWDELVLPPFETELLHDVVAHVRARARVHDRWGFAARGARGLSITALFSGGSGTGKTMAAEVIASALKLDLYRIDLSQVVSKYIGETEKNLRRVFDGAEAGGAILLFDEADALFGKRSEVKDSHDRYANIEVSYLLQRMESYRGLAILTTNLKDALDSAFLRRIRFAVSFPFPTAEQRAEIWRRVFPAGVPREELAYDQLARLNVAGGTIRNIAVYAAFLAADAGTAVSMKHLLRAARVEYAKLERPLSDGEVRGWL